jgi:CRISPR type IV-associated protein Csf1
VITASQLIRQAALATKQLRLKGAKDTIKVIDYADPQLEAVPDPACWLCGGEITGGQGLPTKKAIRPTFTDHPYARGQGSGSVCAGCAFCLSARTLRNYSILATGAGLLQHPSRAEWREILCNPPEPPFVMCLAVSGQKHLSFKAPVNLDRDHFTALLEEREIFVMPDRIAQALVAVEALYAYFTKDEIATGRYSQHRIRECDIARWERLEAGVAEWRGRPLFDLALFVAQKKEPEPAEDRDREKVVMMREPPPTADGRGKGGDKELTGQMQLDWR